MKRFYRSIAVALLQCLLVLTVAAQYAIDRARLPRVWALALPFDPNLPIRGRYVSLRLQVDAPDVSGQYVPVRLTVAGNRLAAQPDPAGTVHITSQPGGRWMIVEPVAFFLPEHAADPTHRQPDEQLWVEVSIPATGAPRPLRLGVKSAGESSGAAAPVPLPYP